MSLQSVHSSHQITQKKLQSHVHFLTADAMNGRLTGTAGEKLATEYVASVFRRLGLEPAGDNDTYFQAFNFTAGISLGPNNVMSITNQQGKTYSPLLNQEWRPLSFSDKGSVEITSLTFAGYGITAPAIGKMPAYDSYHGLHVKNKWVVIFRDAPKQISGERRHQIYPYTSTRYKTFVAKEHGAKGIIFVSGPNANVKDELISPTFDTSLSGSGIIVLSVNDHVLNELLDEYPLPSLQTIQNRLESGEPSPFPVLKNINITGQIDIQQNIQQGRNVLARLRITPKAARMVVIGAHVDHLGHGELSGSLARRDESDRIHPGADDNASGVASVLEAAAKLCSLKAHGRLYGNKDILFAAWSGEEFGVLGSSHFVSHFNATVPAASLNTIIDAAINLDMVGHLRKNLVLQGIGSSSDWLKIIEDMNLKHTTALITQDDPYLPTDSTPFYLHGVPTLNFFTGAHVNYHTPRDTPETLNYEGIKTISNLLVNLVLVIEDRPNSINYQKIKKPSHNQKQDHKIYLGTIPDYAGADISGVKISGIARYSPAEQAGIQPDDVIIELAGNNIHDIYDYTFALNALHVGKPAKLVVLRENAKVSLTIIARYRE